MAANTAISWATHTMNFWVGCDKVSAACDFCYAEKWAKRSGSPELWNGSRRRTKTWRDPYRWDKAALAAGIRPSVFANSLSDFFDNKVPDDWRIAAWDVIRDCQAMDWYLVTKRIPNVEKMLPVDWASPLTDDRPYRHVVIIITVATQAESDRDIPRLLALKRKFPWLRIGLSMEPLLEAVDISRWTTDDATFADYCDAVGGPAPTLGPGLDWVIVGGESGGQAREMNGDWARTIRDQCQRAGVPFHFKQHGEFWGGTRVGVKNAGRKLDGRTHDDGPRQVPS